MSIREATCFYNISSGTLVSTWLRRFKKSDIKGLIPYKSSERPPMKPKYARMPLHQKQKKTIYVWEFYGLKRGWLAPKELRKFRLQEEVRQRNYPKVKSPSFPKSAIRYCRLSTQYVI